MSKELKNNCLMQKNYGPTQLLIVAMAERGINQKQLAESLNKSEGWMSRILSGEIPLTLETLMDIAEVLKVKPGSLVPNSKDARQSFEDWMREISRDETVKVLEEREKAE